MCTAALKIANEWRWDELHARKLIGNLKQYYQCKAPFVGGQPDGRDWWDSLLITGMSHPLKTFASTVLAIVPHSAEVERLFSDLGSIQGVKRCNLTTENFEKLGKLHSNYACHLWEQLGKPMHRKHGHMHTHNTAGINADLATDIQTNFTWSPPLARQGPASNDDLLEGPESITPEDFDAAFDELDQRLKETPKDSEMVSEDGQEVLEGQVYDFEELERVDKGLAPVTFQDDVQVVGSNSGSSSWNVKSLLMSSGVV